MILKGENKIMEHMFDKHRGEAINYPKDMQYTRVD